MLELLLKTLYVGFVLASAGHALVLSFITSHQGLVLQPSLGGKVSTPDPSGITSRSTYVF